MKNTLTISFLALGVLAGLILLKNTSLAAYEISDGSVKVLYHAEDFTDATGNFDFTDHGTGFTTTTGKFNFGFTNIDNNNDWAYNNVSPPPTQNTDNFAIGFWIKLTASTTKGANVCSSR